MSLPAPSADASRASDASLPPSTWSFGPRFWIGVVLVAASAALFAFVFRWSLGAVLTLIGHDSDVVRVMRAAPLWARVVFPTTGGLLAGLIGLLIRRAAGGGGVSDVMEAVVLGKVKLSPRVTVLKSLASWTAILTGGSLGREGPLIQFGGASGKLIGDLLRLRDERTRTLIAAGTAAGFAAAYNTPFAAVLFVLEVVTGVVVLDAIVPTLVATALATALIRAMAGAGPIYGMRKFEMQSPLELGAYIGLGLLAALCSQAFVRLVSGAEQSFRRLPMPWRPALGGLVAGLFLLFLPEVAGNGYEPLDQLLDGSFALGFVALLLIGKACATSASVGSGSPGGIFTPTLLIGGCVGFLYGSGLAAAGIQVGSPAGYALVGMAAATAATTHAPLMAAVMAFELSGDYAIVLPLVLTTGVATLVSRRLRKDSVYTAELRQRGIGWELTLEGRRLVDEPPKS